MTKIWVSTDRDAEFTEAQIMNLEEFIERDIKLMSCEPLAGRFPSTTIQIQSDHPPDDYFNTGGMFVVSEQLKSLLERFNVNAEFFHLSVNYEGAAYLTTKFYFANLLDERECFDFELGECTFHDKPGFTSRIDIIRKLAIYDERVRDLHLLRMANCSDDIVIASDALAESVVGIDATGVRLIAPEVWVECY